ncbi:MAG TPA: CDGSH iron-sulfur domain-containing protein [Nitrospirales bacterium]|nr:CDGSH iron-sulfur domain-containing protein [Nitrospirales bacterium]HIB53483.1 CDGSH iron-sulfur domain-containing protein [Nitrospirales bacterium]HIN33141.1 CDGSH iron-sulfur domain-containing protein [Nitrospirales bacterium]HIO22657.1 CDGSH iron-sulfur domain-containing protein [Nitrospirales bacterium]HIO69452.1 CDGSH iron-sulfur domain-containing protein [Nitrospirales bacterium]
MEEPTVVEKKPTILTLDAGTYYWCQCGKSETQPFCDGSHQGTDFEPKQFTIMETTKVWLCMCKHTHNSPFCDGAHKAL